METPNIDQIIMYTESRDHLYGSNLAEPAQTELDLLKLQAHWREETWQMVLELGKLVNQEQPAVNIDQAADEWGKHVVGIAINRLRKLEEMRELVERQPDSWYRVAVLEFFRQLEASWKE